MAEVLVSIAVEQMVSMAASLAKEGIGLAWGFKGELEKLKQSLRMILAVLQDAEQKQVIDLPVKRWLEHLQDVAYDAQNVLDEIAYEAIRQNVEIKNQLLGKVCNFFSCSNPFAFRLNMAWKIKEINESLNQIKSDAVFPGLIKVPSVDSTLQIRRGRETHGLLGDSDGVIGRESDLENVMNLLVNSTNQQALLAVPIVGMVGLGKTTLAKKVYKEVQDRKLFDVIIWVCVSDFFDVHRILREMLESIRGKSYGVMDNLTTILENLKKKLENKTFLLVLDDVWEREKSSWDSFQESLKVLGKNGKAIVVTTRLEEVASNVQPNPRYRHVIDKLSNDHCWFIIERKVMNMVGGIPIPSDLIGIGQEIAEKCGGVPLVANVLGGTMGSSLVKEKWLSIKNSSVWDKVEDVFKLSFDHFAFTVFEKVFCILLHFSEGFRHTKGGTNSVVDG